MQNVSKVTFVILGAIIGAGFISGQEIYLFFSRFGTGGIIGIIISGAIMGLTIKKTCTIIKENNINNYHQFVDKMIFTDNKYIKLILNNIISIFLLISFFIMCAAFNSYFKQELNIPIYITGIFTCILSYIIFIKKNKLIIKINQVIMPMILLAIIFLLLKDISIINIQKIELSTNIIQIIIYGIIYASYNSILLIPVIITLNKYLGNKQQIKLISAITSITIIILAVIIMGLINSIINIENLEIPLIYVAASYGNIYYYIYSFIILMAIFTTMISVGYGFLENMAKNNKTYTLLNCIICISSIPISYIGFSNLVGLLYPVFGILGIIQIIFILMY